MCDVDEEIDELHWLDDPSFPLGILKTEIERKKFDIPPSSSATFTKVINDAKSLVEKNYGIKEAESFVDDVYLLRHWLRAKEEIHVTYGKINYFLQKILKELGNRWTKQGYLTDSSDIYYLDHVTIRDIIKNPANLLLMQEKQLFHNKSISCMYRKFKIPTLITSSMKSLAPIDFIELVKINNYKDVEVLLVGLQLKLGLYFRLSMPLK